MEIQDDQSELGEIVVSGLTRPLVVVGIPAYNEEKSIARVVLDAQKHADIVVVCDDGSADLTSEIAEKLGAVVVRHERNLGYGAALQSLFLRAWELKADILVTLDADGQHDPAEIPQLLKPINDGEAEVVLGSRFLDKKGTADMPFYRQLGVKIITKLVNRSSKNRVGDAQSGFRAYSKRALARLTMSENGMAASVELLRTIEKCGLPVCEVPISCKYSNSLGVETSSKNPLAHGAGLLMSLIKIIVEDRPLPLLGIPGVFSLGAGTLFGVWMLNIYSTRGQIETNVALASISFLLIGFFLISTGVTLYSITRIAAKMKSANKKEGVKFE
jgi:glycosyltransferase involved in cell wall biosynthesis